MHPERFILHLDLDTFFVSVERLHDRSLMGKPVIIGGMGNRGVVSSCSYEARAFGVRSAMSMFKARQLCPHAVYLKGNMEAYAKASRLVTTMVAEAAPLFEKASIDEFYLDLSGMDRFFGCFNWSKQLREKIIRETGLPISFGLSANKMISKVATGEAKPNGFCYVAHGKEQAFLDPKPIQKIPMAGAVTTQFLLDRGIQTIYQLRQQSPELLEKWLGKAGTSLWNKAHGQDFTPVIPYQESKSISTERTFETDQSDLRKVREVIHAMADKLAFELRTSGRLASTIAIKIRYPGFETVSRQTVISPTDSTRKFREKALDLFDKLYDPAQRIRLVGVRLSGLQHGSFQLDLFENTKEEAALNQAIDAVKRKYGNHKLVQAGGLRWSRSESNDPGAVFNRKTPGIRE